MFELDFQNIMILVSLAIQATLLWILFRYGRKTLNGRAYLIVALSVAAWILPMSIYRSHFLGETLIWARLLYIMASFTSITFLFFTLVFPNNKKVPFWIQLTLLVENLLIVLLCLHPTLMIRGVKIVANKEDIILWGRLYFIYVIHIILPFFIGFIILFLKWRRSKGLLRRQILYILSGYFFAANLAMATNLILPWFGYFELNWIGQFFSTIVAGFTVFAILRLQLLNIKLIASEGFLLLLNLFVLFRLIVSNGLNDLVINIFVFIIVLIFSYLLLRSVYKEVKRRQEITHLAHSLEKANLRLKELDRQKTEFLSIASHQLRTPLSILKGYIELIKDGAYGKPSKQMIKILNNMDESNERLAKLVDEFLDISRIEQGRTKFNFKKSNLNEIISDVIKELSERAVEKDLKINWKPLKTIGKSVLIDSEKIRHVILNFIDNAIKYTDKGTIRISIENEYDGVTVRVKDSGLGFNKKDEANFFQKFYRGNNIKGTNVNGTGLGLYICSRFIEAHEGNIWGHSKGLGKGSEFGFWLPNKRKK